MAVLTEKQNYWCIKNSIESEEYGDYTPQKPWLGRLEKSAHGVWWLYTINEENGSVDHDSNASNIVEEKDLFPTKEEASAAYIQKGWDHIESLYEEAYKKVADLMKYIKENGKCPTG